MKNFLKKLGVSLLDNLKVVIISLAIVIPIRYYVIQPFFVIGASMEPNFQTGDYLVIDQLSYFFREPRRGEVIVFHFPFDTRQYYIKRIIGLPNETIEIRDNQVFIKNDQELNGFFLKEDYPLIGYTVSHGIKLITLGSDEYFVLGDNRLQSSDSRVFGGIARKHIVGRALIRAFPFNKIGILNN